MSRRFSQLDLSIRGDEVEQNRILLEHTLQHTDLSLHLSSAPEDNDSDIECPRHNSVPAPFPGFASFEQQSGDHFDPTEQSQYQPWSYRSFNADDTTNPYAGETISTAAHHASALTISAGLGGRGPRRDVSLSGAEYDPDRPLHGIVAGFHSRISAFDMETPKSKSLASNVMTYDPLVVDDTAELDRVLQSGHARIPASVVRSPVSSFASSSPTSESNSPRPQSPALRPRLSDALQTISFSPKRPRSVQSQVSSRAHSGGQPVDPYNGRAQSPQPFVRIPSPSMSSEQHATPRPRQVGRTNRSQSCAHQQSLSYVQVERDPMKDVVNQVHGLPNARLAAQGAKTKTPYKQRLHLPDVTGLTSAVESPAKFGLEYRRVNPNNSGNNQTTARLVAAINAVQSKLAFLESENSISRRRVYELELELENCKQEVARERTKVLECEDPALANAANDADIQERERIVNLNKLPKGKLRAPRRDAAVDARERSVNEIRYKEAVEEKKALEALITTLRNHLSRLTAELSDHQRLLLDLQALRDSDAAALAEKGRDIDNLRQQVERLAGEVEVLRGVVEEGLRERRIAREQASQDVSQNDVNGLVESSDSESEGVTTNHTTVAPNASLDTDSDVDEGSTTSSRDQSPTQSPHRRPGLMDRTMRTDYATLGSSVNNDMSSKPFVDANEIERISMDLQERRSERSISHALSRSQSQMSRSLSISQSRTSSRCTSPALALRASRVVSTPSSNSRRSAEDSEEDQTSVSGTRPERVALPISRPSSPERPAASAPTATHAQTSKPTADLHEAARDKTSAVSVNAATDAPFPRIRGAHLEQLFFSAPEHNVQTCTVCHRRRRSQRVTSGGSEPLSHRRLANDEDDEGFAEGPDEFDPSNPQTQPSEDRQSRSKHSGNDQKVPPQTVVARVVRELEDDFTHYKSIYIELSDQYKLMDAVSNVAKRNVVAGHLREVIDILEQKGDQIASLYDLLTFQDKPATQSVVPEKQNRPVAAEPSSWGRARGLRTRLAPTPW